MQDDEPRWKLRSVLTWVLDRGALETQKRLHEKSAVYEVERLIYLVDLHAEKSPVWQARQTGDIGPHRYSSSENIKD